MMADTTISGGWREKGNASYRNFVDSNSSERQRNYLESALRSYYRAYETAESNQDKSSAAKNYAMAAWRLTTVLSQLNEVTVHCEFRFREAISYFSKVLLLNYNKLCWLLVVCDYICCASFVNSGVTTGGTCQPTLGQAWESLRSRRKFEW